MPISSSAPPPHRAKLRRICACLGLCWTSACLVEINPKFETGAADGAGTETTATEDTGGDEPEPPQPPSLQVHLLGDSADADVDPLGPGLILQSGTEPLLEAFTRVRELAAGGDVIVLSPAMSNALTEFLYTDVGGFDSVETLIVNDSGKANDPWVAWKIRHAEAIVLFGEDQNLAQTEIHEDWVGSELIAAIEDAWDRGAVIAGQHGALTVLGEFTFTGAAGSLTSQTALGDPYESSVVLARDLFAIPLLAGVIVDNRMASSDRMGRLLVFMARVLADGWASEIVGLGIDDDTALLIDAEGQGEVVGLGQVYIVRADMPADVCEMGTPLEFGPVALVRLGPGDTSVWPDGASTVSPLELTASGGELTPVDPYNG